MNEVLVKNRGRAGAPAVRPLADALSPNLLAVEVEAIDARLAEEDVQTLAVADRRVGGIAVVSALRPGSRARGAPGRNPSTT